MPIYEYQCDGCEQVFEVRQKISDPAPASHACGSTQVRRILSATSFVLKGTGWYKTDYADKDRAQQESRSAASSKQNQTDKAASSTDAGSAASDKAGAADKGTSTKDGQTKSSANAQTSTAPKAAAADKPSA